ncbi:MAG: MipA/OmpV family protein [Sphingomonas sp.]
MRKATLGITVIALAIAAPAVAQEGRGWTVTVGGGAQIAPKFYGSNDHSIFPLPNFGLRREGRPMPFEAPDDSFGIGLLGQDSSFNFGPVGRLTAGRDEDDVGAPVGDVGLTVEVGGFVQAFLGENFRLRGELRQGIGGHDGLVGNIAADFIIRDGDNTIFSIGPRVHWADNDFHDAYFGVPAAIPAAGLTAYNPRSGFYAIGGRAGLTQRLGRNWGLFGYAGYDRLIGDAADSPIVRQLGSRDQFSGGLGLFLEFNVGGG